MDYNMIAGFFQIYGWQLGALTLCGIIFLGLLKWFGVFNKVSPKIKKYLYFGLSCIFSIIACTIYLLCTVGIVLLNYITLCVAVIGFTLAIYGLYENTGLRALWQKVLKLIEKLFKTTLSAIMSGTLNEDKLKSLASKLSIEALNELIGEAKTKENENVQENIN